MKSLLRRSFILIFCVCFGHSLAFGAKIYNVVKGDPQSEAAFRKNASGMWEQDQVRVFNSSGQELYTFHLIERLGNGSMGIVFLSTNEHGQRLAIKFPIAGEAAVLRYMDDEVRSLKTIKQNHLPVVEIGRYEPGIFLEKEYIAGGDLLKVMKNWKKFSEAEKSEQIEGLAKFIHTLKSAKFSISGLHCENIIWDSKFKLWKILDPEITKPSITGRASVSKLLEDFKALAPSGMQHAYQNAFQAAEGPRAPGCFEKFQQLLRSVTSK